MMVFNVFIFLSPLLSSNGFWWITSRREASAVPNPKLLYGSAQVADNPGDCEPEADAGSLDPAAGVNLQVNPVTKR
jgi:hypothetical protein